MAVPRVLIPNSAPAANIVVDYQQATMAPPSMDRIMQTHGTMTRLDLRRNLADTGALVCATGNKGSLHDFTTATPYEIKGDDGIATAAAGQVMAHVRHPTTGEVEHMFFVYIPSVQGTIVSLEHHAHTHPKIHRWTQEATPIMNSGWVTFYDINDEVVSRYPTEMEKGLYYIQNLIFLPAPEHDDTAAHHLNQLTSTRTDDTNDEQTVRIHNS